MLFVLAHNISLGKASVLALVLLVISFLLWRSKRTEEEQREAVIKVLLSISERNYQQCGMYFRNITNILSIVRE
jgi:predicted nucleic-acid-binding protein